MYNVCVKLAQKFSDEDAYKIINGILDTIDIDGSVISVTELTNYIKHRLEGDLNSVSLVKEKYQI